LESLKYRTVINEVGIFGLYRGFWPLFWRDVPAWAVYFWAYELFKNKTSIKETEIRGDSLSNK